MTKSNKPVVIITGVSSGIGLETAKLFSSRGWLVVGTVRSRRLPEELATHAVDIQVAEMSQPTDLARVVERTLKTYGRIDALVANAGYGLWGRLDGLNYAQVMAQLAVNLGAAVEIIRLVTPVMKRAGKGSIVAVSSVVGQVGLPDAPAYAASKHGLEGLMESLWLDEALEMIKWRLIEPGPTNSGFWNNRVLAGAKTMPGARAKRLPVPKYRGGGANLESSVIAETIYRSVGSASQRLRYAGSRTVSWLFWAKRLLPETLFGKLMRQYYGRNK